jgi:hypothetical protein
MRHTIETTGGPVFAKARRLDPDKLRQAEAEFRDYRLLNLVMTATHFPASLISPKSCTAASSSPA